MRRVLGKISLYLALSSAFLCTTVVVVLVSLVDYFSPPAFFTSLANVQNVSAESFVIFDIESGEVLFEKNADEKIPVASIAKLIAAVVVFHEDYIWNTATVTWSDLEAEGRAGKLSYGESYMIYTLLFPLLLESSNDAARVFERNDQELINKMNTYTETLSIQNTKFADASGLSQENAGTARELSVLLRKIRQEEKHIIDITSLPMYLSSDNGWVNNNPFVNDQNYIGGKHGYTHESLYTAALIFNEPLNNGVNREVGYIVLGSHDLQSDIPLLQNAVQTQLVNL